MPCRAMPDERVALQKGWAETCEVLASTSMKTLKVVELIDFDTYEQAAAPPRSLISHASCAALARIPGLFAGPVVAGPLESSVVKRSRYFVQFQRFQRLQRLQRHQLCRSHIKFDSYAPRPTVPTHLTSPHLTSSHLTSPHLTSPHLTSRLCVICFRGY